MHLLLFLLATLAADAAPAGGAVEATIRGTKQPLAVELLLRQEDDTWTKVGHRELAAGTRRVRFDGLESGVYQLRVGGRANSEQFAMKIGVGRGDVRRTTIAIEPRELQGRVTLGGVNLGAGALLLRHNEFHWSAAIPIAPDGSFRAPLWQEGKYSYTIQTPSLPTPFSALMELDGAPVEIEIPDGRITGTVRDAATGAPLAGATVALQTNTGTAEQHVRTATDAAGKFDFVGMKYARHTVRISLPAYLDPQPLRFELDGDNRLRTFDVSLDRGRTVPLLVIDANDDPVDEATVYAMAGGRVCARVTTDEDGRTEIAVPQRGDATLFVIPPDGAFAVARVAREHSGGRMRVYLPRAASSLSIRAQTTAGADMPPFSLLMRYNGVLVPLEVSEELSVTLGHRLTTGRTSEVELDRIPSGSYEFWPYRTEDEATAIVESGDGFSAPIQVNVRTGENKIAVKFTTR